MAGTRLLLHTLCVYSKVTDPMGTRQSPGTLVPLESVTPAEQKVCLMRGTAASQWEDVPRCSLEDISWPRFELLALCYGKYMQTYRNLCSHLEQARSETKGPVKWDTAFLLLAVQKQPGIYQVDLCWASPASKMTEIFNLLSLKKKKKGRRRRKTTQKPLRGI